MREFTISEMAVMFDLTRPTIRARLKAANLGPIRIQGVKRLYDMRDAAPAIFAVNAFGHVRRVNND